MASCHVPYAGRRRFELEPGRSPLVRAAMFWSTFIRMGSVARSRHPDTPRTRHFFSIDPDELHILSLQVLQLIDITHSGPPRQRRHRPRTAPSSTEFGGAVGRDIAAEHPLEGRERSHPDHLREPPPTPFAARSSEVERASPASSPWGAAQPIRHLSSVGRIRWPPCLHRVIAAKREETGIPGPQRPRRPIPSGRCQPSRSESGRRSPGLRR